MVAANQRNESAEAFFKKTERRLNSIERHRHAGMSRVVKSEKDVPKPPTFVQYENTVIGGYPSMRTTWTAPTENTDGTDLTDLGGYHVQQQIGLTTEWAAPTEWAPGKPDETLNRLFNRNGLGLGWTGGDGGASGRDTSGTDWWFWSDSNWGALAGNGDTLRWIMMRNSITSTVGTDPESTTLYAGRMNLIREAPQAADWSPRGSDTVADVAGGVEWTTTVGNIDLVQRVPVESGQGVTFTIAADGATVTPVIDWFDASGYTGVNVQGQSTQNALAAVHGTAPDGATEARLRVSTSTSGAIVLSQVYVTYGDARMASWRSGIKEFQFTNLILNPTGSGSAPTSGSAVLYTNRAFNPSNEADVGSNTRTYNGVTVERVEDSEAWVGDHVQRLTRGQAGNGLLALLDFNSVSGDVAAGDEVTYRFRVRAGSLAASGSTLDVRVGYYDGGSGNGSESDTTVDLSGQWTTVTVTGTAPAGTNNLGIRLGASGAAWSASDEFDVDARELYINSQPPQDYFDGSTPDGGSWLHTWTGTPYESPSTATLAYVQRTNLALDPTMLSGANWSSVMSSMFEVDGGDARRENDTVALPEVVDASVIDPIRAALDDPNAQVGIGVVSDSTGETTGSWENHNLADRYVETLQEALRRYQKSPDVLLTPEGYYGASAYVAAEYRHTGPIDWITNGPTTSVSDMGVGGRAVALPYGSRVSLRATFDSATIELPTWTYGRDAAIYVDGDLAEMIDTYSIDFGLIQWDTGSLGYGEHLVTIESRRVPGLPDGDVRVAGAMLFDGASDAVGTRVFDMSASGLAAEDMLNKPSILEADLSRPVDLMIWSLGFNDAGRGITPAQHKANLNTLLDEQATHGFSGVNLLMAKWEPASTVTAEWPAPMADYAQVMRELAQERADTAFIDLSEVMPGPDENPALYQDYVHQNEVGNQRVASILRGVILGSGNTGSLRVETNAQGEGVHYSGVAAGAFDDGQPFTASVYVRGPVGRVVEGRVAATGQPLSTGAPVTLTGGWDRVVVSGRRTPSATAQPVVQFVQADTGGAMEWRLSDLLIEDGIGAGEFFYSGTPDTAAINYDLNSDGESTASGYSPVHWETEVGTMVVFDPDMPHDFDGSVHVFPTGTGPAQVDVMMAGNSVGVTHAGWVFIPTAGQTVEAVGLRWDGSQYIESGSDTVTGPGWVEFRFEGQGTHGGVRLRSDEAFHAAEVTVVSDPEPYTGPTFSGGSRGAHAESVWNGEPGSSTSTLTMNNTSYTEDPHQRLTLIMPESAGLEGWKFLWCQGAQVIDNYAVMFLQTLYHRPTIEDTGFNFHRSGDIVMAFFDLSTGVLTEVVNMFPQSPQEWGEASFVEGSYMYVYGKDGEHVYAMRVSTYGAIVPSAWSSAEVWDGSAWTTGGTPSPVADSQWGFTGVRELAGQYVALEVGGFSNHLQSWVAPAPEGPFVPDDIVYVFPDDGVNRYVPRFHPQFDTNSGGIVMSVCEAGGNKYAPFFLRGPAGDRSANFGDAYWGPTHIVDSEEFIQSLVEPGTPYRVRVRAFDKHGNLSTWTLGDEVISGGWDQGVPQPSAPIATAWFRGGRVVWDGLTKNGEEYEDFQHYEVHLNEGSPNWTLSAWTRVDSSTVEGGVTPVTVNDYSTYYVRVVVVTAAGKSEPSEPVSFQPERLSDPDLPQTLIDGARLEPGTVSASALTVSAFTDNLLPNSNFEDEARDAPGMPARWNGGWPRGEGDWADLGWEASGSFSRSEVDPISGVASLRIETKVASWRQVVSDVIPLQPGDIYYVAARVRTDGIDGEVAVSLLTGYEQDDVNGFASDRNDEILVGVTAGGQSSMLVEGPVEVRDRNGDGSGYPMRFGAVSIEARATGRVYTTWVDEVEVKRVVGTASIANASINRAKIRYLAVDDARIASMSVGKLVAGELFADITVSSRIMTAKSGKRWEANINGSFTFNPDLTGGDDQIPVTEMRGTDGALVSRWFATNTDGTRMEMGRYGAGANDALIAFYPDSDPWQFPPAFGYGGAFRQGSIPGLAMHAGSHSTSNYDEYGMSIVAVDQVGGGHMYTGNLLDGSEANAGAPITLNAGGSQGSVEILAGGGYMGSGGERARLYLSPWQPDGAFTQVPSNPSRLDLNFGVLSFMPIVTMGEYSIRFADDNEWPSTPYSHMLFTAGYGGFRFSTANQGDALIISSGGIIQGSGWDYCAKIQSRGTGQGNNYVSFMYNGIDPPEIWAYDDAANLVSAKTFVIDHPDDPDRYLVHAAVEGPTADVGPYRGEAALVDGEVTIALPDYFDSLTVPGSATVQLTPIVGCGVPGCTMRGAPILAATPVEGGRFTVEAAGGVRHDHARFYWTVFAQRANTPVEVEPLKSDVTVAGDGPYTYITGSAR